MIYSPNASIFDSDAYGVNTDNPECASEILDNMLNNGCRFTIKAGFNDWLKETAREYFDTSDWNDEYWDGWEEIIKEII